MKKLLFVLLCVLLIGLAIPQISNAQDNSMTKEEVQKEIEEILYKLSNKTSEEQAPLLLRLDELFLLWDELNYGIVHDQEIVNEDNTPKIKTVEEIMQEIELLKQELEERNIEVQNDWEMLQRVQEPDSQHILPLSAYELNYTESIKARDEVQNRISNLMQQLEQLYEDEINSVESEILNSPFDKALYTRAGEIYNKYGIEGIKLFINGERIELDIKPFIENGRTLVPLRGVCEKLGATVAWDGDVKTISISKNKLIIMTIGKKTATIDNQTVTLDAAPKIVDNRTFIPLRFVAENLNSEVSYDGNTSIIIINSK